MGQAERRRQERNKRRLTCELLVGARRYPAIVRDISRAGLFVQTRARPEPNSVVELVFPARDGQPEIRVEAGVARQRLVRPGLESMVPGGVGLEVLDPPPRYRDLVARGETPAAVEAKADERPGDAPDGGIRTFRVKVAFRGKPASRVLTVRSESVHGARARALSRAGQGWKISDIQEI